MTPNNTWSPKESNNPTRNSRNRNRFYTRRRNQRLNRANAKADEVVLNDANVSLSRDQLHVLNLGLSFSPKTNFNADKFAKDLEYYRRNINLRIHWSLHENTQRRSHLSSTCPSTWEPPNLLKNHETNWINFCNALNDLPRSRPKTNMSRRQTEAWKDLINNESIKSL